MSEPRIPLKNLLPPRAYDALKIEQAARKASHVDDDREKVLQAQLDLQCKRIPEYHDRAGYEAYKLKLNMPPDQAGRFERSGFIVQPKQMEFGVWCRACDLPDGPEEVGFGGAKGGGKSFMLMLVAAIDDCQRCPGLTVLFLRYTAKSAKEQIGQLAEKIFKRHKEVSVTKEKISFPNGSSITIGGFNNDRQALNYAGIENDVLIVEEATQLSAKTHETLRGTNRSSKPFGDGFWRPRRYYSTNPLGVGHAFFKKRFIDNERKRAKAEREIAETGHSHTSYDPRQKFIFAKVEDNYFVNPEYIGVLDSYSGAQREAYREGNWDVSAGAYFNQWSYDDHVFPAFLPDKRTGLIDLSYMRRFYASMDYGYNHWNVVHLHCEDGDGNTYTIDEIAHRRHYPSEIAPEIFAMLAKYGVEDSVGLRPLVPDDLEFFLIGTDAFASTGRSKATIVQQYSDLGIDLSRAENSPGSRVAGAQEMSRLLGAPERGIAPTWFISDLCERLIECMSYLEIDPTNAEDVLKTDTDEQGRGGDDAYDSARYGVYHPHLTTVAES